MVQIDNEFIGEHVSYSVLIEALRAAFRADQIACPPKSIYDYQSRVSGDTNNSMLIMPAWDNQAYIGVKIISATPSNAGSDAPYLNGRYLLFDAGTGVPLASMDAKLITHMRTAATSVLASLLLARPDASSVLIIGNGQISPHYIRAYAALDQVNTIYLWGRNQDRSHEVLAGLGQISASVSVVSSFTSVINDVDIISCITSAQSPLILQEHVRAGQHLDLAGSFTPDMMEVSPEVVAMSELYVDNRDVTPYHAGELVQAIVSEKITIEHIRGDLHQLCSISPPRMYDPSQITLFKSTGMATEDLVIATLIHEAFNRV